MCVCAYILNFNNFDLQSPDDYYDDEWDDDSECGGGSSTITSATTITPNTQYPAIGVKTTSMLKTSGI